VKRLLVALGVVAAVALLALLLWPDDEGSGPAAAPPPVAPAREAPEAPAETRPVTRAEVPAPAPRPSVEPPNVPVLFGVLRCDLSKPVDLKIEGECTLRVLLPGGQELASKHVGVPGTTTFTGLPTGVPLVVAASAKGCLSGLCCDVLLAKDAPSSKRIALRPAPAVNVDVTVAGRTRAPEGLRVELLSGDAVVAEGVTDRDSRVELRPPVFGEFRARVTAAGQTLVAGEIVVVDATADVQFRTIDVPEGGAVEVQVLLASGAPAPHVSVWLLGESPERPPVQSDSEGVAVFRNVPRTRKFSAVARGPNGTFASAEVTSDDPTHARIPLLLGDPATLSGDVVDQGNAAIRGAVVEVIARPLLDPVTVRSDEAGLFETPPLPGGLAEVVVHCEGYVDWHSQETVEIRPGVGAKIRARMTPRPTGTVFVRVRDEAGAPVADAEVTASPARVKTATNAAGECCFDRLDAGTDQAFYARRRGYRTRSGAMPSVRVPRDSGTGVVIVLRAARAESPEGGSVTANGVVLDPAGEAVVGARVTAGADVTYTDAAGHFRLTGLTATAADPVDVRIVPTPSLLEPLRLLVDADERGLADAGTVRLRTRPYALLRVPAMPDLPAYGKRSKDAKSKNVAATGDDGVSRVFWFSSNHAQTLLGAVSNAFDPVACVSYDGTWMHLPPADDWTTDGRGEVFVGFPTSRGLFTTAAAWTLAPDAAPVLVPAQPDAPSRLEYDSRWPKGRVTVRQVECATLFDPRSIHVPTGDPQGPVDPFSRLAAWRSFSVDTNDWREFAGALAAGRWVVGNDRDARTVGRPAGVEWTYRQRK